MVVEIVVNLEMWIKYIGTAYFEFALSFAIINITFELIKLTKQSIFLIYTYY